MLPELLIIALKDLKNSTIMSVHRIYTDWTGFLNLITAIPVLEISKHGIVLCDGQGNENGVFQAPF